MSKASAATPGGRLALAVALAVACCLAPGAAWADESLGSVEEPARPIAPASATDAATVERTDQDDDGVEVSAAGDAALVEGARFAIADFVRAQSGSNRPVNGAYQGYNYYLGAEPDTLAVVSTGAYAVVYVPEGVCRAFRIDLSSPEDQQLLRRYLVALDSASARGSARLETVGDWRFTSQGSYDVDGVEFRFAVPLQEGRYYLCVVGEDGTDVTSPSHPHQVDLAFADFGLVVDPHAVAIEGSPTGLAWLASFLGEVDYSPLWVTLRTTGVAIVLVFVLGLAAACFVLRLPPRAQDAFDSLFTIPMVLPPTVCGFLLLLAFGRSTPLGQWFIDVGFPLVFSWQATVIAAVIVAFPLMYRSARGAFEGLDANMLDAARTLGWSDARVFFRLMMPLAWSSIAAGTVLAFARALGEFGATLFLAGNYAGVTRTIPIAIYFEWMNGNTDVAVFWTIVIILFSFVVILFINLWGRRTTMYRRSVQEGTDGSDRGSRHGRGEGAAPNADGRLEAQVAALDARDASAAEGGAR